MTVTFLKRGARAQVNAQESNSTHSNLPEVDVAMVVDGRFGEQYGEQIRRAFRFELLQADCSVTVGEGIHENKLVIT